MRYHLLTGATGLLGCYLLKDAAALDVPLAVVVRSSRTASARQRVEDLLARWEHQTSSLLPRPVVLEGDLTKPGLGLKAAQIDWIRESCSSVIHNAASLSFVAESQADEPYRSNVGGTQNVLDLCRETGIRNFHHVSTAYVCGLREGTILESERNVGQTLGNDYERSKIAAEELVAGADYIDSKTFFRPGIIIGDSRTGYTSTFHGFYVPLKITNGLLHSVKDLAGVSTSDIVRLFGLDGTETKNFVPVDWVSAVMMRVIATPEHHGKTYHLTPTERTRFTEMSEAMAEANDKSPKIKSQGNISYDFFRNTLLDQMKVYEAYWRDDPVFDRTNTLAAAPDLPCPVIDKALLLRMCQYAVKSNFGWPIAPSRIPPIDVGSVVQNACQPSLINGTRPTVVGLVITGPGGGDWELQVIGNDIVEANEGLTPRCHTIIRLGSHTLKEISDGHCIALDALQIGRLSLEGRTGASSPDLCEIVDALVRRRAKGLSLENDQDGPLVSAI